MAFFIGETMAEVFKWRTQIQETPTGEFRHRVKEVEFGDGYKQVSGDGINTESQSWPFTYTGQKTDVMPILLLFGDIQQSHLYGRHLLAKKGYIEQKQTPSH